LNPSLIDPKPTNPKVKEKVNQNDNHLTNSKIENKRLGIPTLRELESAGSQANLFARAANQIDRLSSRVVRTITEQNLSDFLKQTNEMIKNNDTLTLEELVAYKSLTEEISTSPKFKCHFGESSYFAYKSVSSIQDKNALDNLKENINHRIKVINNQAYTKLIQQHNEENTPSIIEVHPASLISHVIDDQFYPEENLSSCSSLADIDQSRISLAEPQTSLGNGKVGKQIRPVIVAASDHLDLAGKDIVIQLKKNPNAITVKLNVNQLPPKDLKKLYSELTSMKRLKTVEIIDRYGFIIKDSTNYNHFAEFILNLNKLKVDSISVDTMSLKGETLRQMARMNRPYNITNLDLSRCENITSNDLIAFFSKNNNFTKLMKLSLSNYLSGYRNNYNDEVFTTLAQCKNFRSLKSLNLNYMRDIAQEGLLKLVSSENFPDLVELDLSFSPLNGKVIEALANGKIFPNLVKLKLANHSLTEKDLMSLVSKDKKHSKLEVLDLFYNYLYGTERHNINGPVTGAIFNNLANTFPNLTSLNIARNRYINDSIIKETIINNNAFCNLGSLNLSNTNISASSLIYLLDNKYFANLKHLNLSACNLKDIAEVLKTLANNKKVSKLTNLNIADTDISNKGLEALASGKYLRNLTTLDLSGVRGITEEGLIELVSSGNFPNLETLKLKNLKCVTDKVFEALAKNENFTKLTSIDLDDTAVSNKNFETLTKSKCLHNLTQLNLGRRGGWFTRKNASFINKFGHSEPMGGWA
jgi:hypothetical protein